MSEARPTILFVEAEMTILKSLQRLFENENWDCHYVASSQEALDVLQQRSVDLIVTEVTLPGAEGTALLGQIKQEHPETVRLFLTSTRKDEKITQALESGDAQQIIPKPWIDQEFKEIIRSALRQSQLQKSQSPRLQILLNSIPLLPALPRNYLQVRNCISDDEVDFEKMANIISRDAAISTALLHWANSALFGQRFQVDTIHKAIVVLGTDIVESLILSETINRSIAKKLPEIPGFKHKKFQQHAFATAIISRLLIKSLFSNDTDHQDRAFICGLLHDIGKFTAANFFTAQFSSALSLAEERQCPLAEVEIETIGASHSELGSYLAEWWSLPPVIVNAIRWHHEPKSTPIARDIIDAVHVANQLSYQFGYGANHLPTSTKSRQESWDRFYLSDEGIEILQFETEKMLSAIGNL